MRIRLAAIVLGCALVAAVPCAAFAATPLQARGSGSEAAFDPSSARPMAADALKRRLTAGERVLVIDGREDLAGEIVEGAVHVTEERLMAWSDTAPKDAVLVFYCDCSDDGVAIGDVLAVQNLGFTNAYYLVGGLEAARKAGLPVVNPRE